MSKVSVLEAALNDATGHALAVVLQVEREHQERGPCACIVCRAGHRYRRALAAWGAATTGDGLDPEAVPPRKKAQP